MLVLRCLLPFLISTSVAVNAQTPRALSDPLFGIRYDIRQVKFEQIPNTLVHVCPELKKRYQSGWVYAHTKSGSTEYFIVSGLMPNFDENGIIVAIRGSRCNFEAQDSFYWLTDSSEWKLREEVRLALAADAIQRYVAAFGGKQQFLSKLKSRKALEAVDPILRQQVEGLSREE